LTARRREADRFNQTQQAAASYRRADWLTVVITLRVMKTGRIGPVACWRTCVAARRRKCAIEVGVSMAFRNECDEKRGSGSEIKREMVSWLAVAVFGVRIMKLAEWLLKKFRSETPLEPSGCKCKLTADLRAQRAATMKRKWNTLKLPPVATTTMAYVDATDRK
jgi:hypothetical protein